MASEPVEVVPLTLHIGAEIRGVDLTRPLPAEQLKAVRDAFLKWKVIFFRGQNLDHAQHVAMARQFGEPTIGHAVFGHVEGHPEIYSVAKNRTANEKYEAMTITPWFGWHTDVTAAVNPPCASILRGVTIPPYGGDTFWTNLVAAYAGLSEPMRAFVDGLRAIHAFEPRGGSEYNETRQASCAAQRASAGDGACGDRRARVVRQPVLPQIAGRVHAARKFQIARDSVGARGPSRIHGAFQMEPGRHRVLGQSLHLAPGAAGHFPVRLRSAALSDHAGGREAGRRRRQAVAVDRRRADPIGSRRSCG